MRISQRLNFLLITSVIMMSAMLGINYYDRQNIIYIKEQASIVDAMAVVAYKLHREERDFFLKLDMTHAEKHAQFYADFERLIASIDPNILGDSRAFTQAMQAYRDSFKLAVAHQQNIGLTPTTGLYGRLRESVHAIESDLKQYNLVDLTAQMLMLRRHEKDFMLRRDDSYVKKFKMDSASFKTALEKAPLPTEKIAHLSQLAQAYQADFLALVDAETRIGIKDHPGLRETMRDKGVELEEALTRFYSSANANEASATLRAELIVLVLFIFAISVIIVLLLQTRRRIIQPINDIVTDIKQITRSVSLKHHVAYQAQDEIGELATAFNQLMKSIDSGLSEANRVVSAIATANFEQRMTGQYVGDLDQLKLGVNASANSVSFMMSELEKVMLGMNQGRFDVQMDRQVPEAFRNLVELALRRAHDVLSDVNKAMQRMANGDFDGRVTATAEGDLKDLKDNMNKSMDDIGHTIHAISHIVEQQAQGNLTLSLPDDKFKGQLQELKDAINFSSKKVKETVIKVTDASNVVNEAATQVSLGAADLSARVQQQASALEETSATMNEMAAAVQANTSNAQRVADLAHNVQSQANEGAQVMQETISAMQAIKESSSQIADIVTIIDGIAFQTNLLALNAAVEAARAGDHGRGFAVVASEVRALAQKSAEAAKDIKTLIVDSVNRIEVGTTLADKSGDMLSGITESISEVAVMVEQIAGASKEQSIGISQVHQAMTEIDRVTQGNAALVEETNAAAESLRTEAHHLIDSIGFFNTGVVSHAHYHAKHATTQSKPNGNTKPTASHTGGNSLALPKPAQNQAQEWTNF